jgi:hypothetical protein
MPPLVISLPTTCVFLCSYTTDLTGHKITSHKTPMTITRPVPGQVYHPNTQIKIKQAETGIWLLKSSEKRRTLTY